MTLERELENLLNRHSIENASNTPDFILAEFMLACLGAFNEATRKRTAWDQNNPDVGTLDDAPDFDIEVIPVEPKIRVWGEKEKEMNNG